MTPPLDGVRVVDLTQVMAGPFCTMLLADLGADVIKVEPPGGDLSRSMGGRRLHMKGKDHAPFIALNRNKRSIVLDLKVPSDRDRLLALVADADVLVENFRPGVAERLGVGFATVATSNPRLIYCSISGFGQSGPWADRPGFDLIAQGMAGVMSVTGDADGTPVKCGIPISDLGGRPVCGQRHPGRAPRARENRPRAAGGDVAVRGGVRPFRLGSDRILGHRRSATTVRLGAPPERAVPGIPRQRRLPDASPR